MKKLFAFFLAIVMIATIAIPASAEATIDSHGDSATIIVSGIFLPSGGEFKTISVDLVWDEMTFTYIKTSSGDWNPDTHEYEGGIEGAWSEETSTITVTNHSNKAVTATFAYESEADYTTISGNFSDEENVSLDNNQVVLASAETTAYEQAPSVTVYLTLDGELTETTTTSTKIGTVTVAIS